MRRLKWERQISGDIATRTSAGGTFGLRISDRGLRIEKPKAEPRGQCVPRWSLGTSAIIILLCVLCCPPTEAFAKAGLCGESCANGYRNRIGRATVNCMSGASSVIPIATPMSKETSLLKA